MCGINVSIRSCLVVLASLSSMTLFAPAARAELDPDLAAVGGKNESGMFVGGNLGFGQSRNTDGSTPAVAYNLNVEPGFAFRRDSWNRIEGSLQIGTGRIGYSNSDGSVSMPIFPASIASSAARLTTRALSPGSGTL